MKKKHYVYLFIALSAVLLWLLWRNRNKIAPNTFNTPPENYLTINYPTANFTNPILTDPKSNASCGCNPDASKLLTGASNKLNDAQDKINKQIDDYINSMNNFFQTNSIN